MVSQFISPDDVGLLGDLDFTFPEGIHAIGRLDNLSEGLLILTNNKKVTRLLFQGEKPHERTYLVKVKHIVSAESLEQLRRGVNIRIRGGGYYISKPCSVEIVNKPDNLFSHPYEKNVDLPHTWLLITLTEGKFHQVRKMCDAIHHRCIRLIRLSIEDLKLGDLQPGEVKEFEEEDFFKQLNITNWR